MSEVWGVTWRCAALMSLVILPMAGAVAVVVGLAAATLATPAPPAPIKSTCKEGAHKHPFRKATPPESVPCNWIPARKTAHTGEALNSLTLRSNDNGN